MDSSNSIWKLISDLSNKKGISELLINDSERVFVERDGQFIQLNVNLETEDFLPFTQDIVRLNQLDPSQDWPIIDGRLNDGSRINIISPPYVDGMPAISIRKYLPFLKSFGQSPEVFGLGSEWVKFLQSMVWAKKCVLVSGGTGAGKTTMLNLLIREIYPNERVVILEDTIEIKTNLSNCVRLKAHPKKSGPGMRELVKNSLRMHPDRIIVGEVRGGEVFDLLQAMNTGHEGSMASIHSNSPSECFSRIENLFLLSGIDVPLKAIRSQVVSAVDFIVQIKKVKDNKRIVSQINEVTGLEGDQILSQVIAQSNGESLEFSGFTPKCFHDLVESGGLDEDFFAGK